jgi:hypothetical protein
MITARSFSILVVVLSLLMLASCGPLEDEQTIKRETQDARKAQATEPLANDPSSGAEVEAPIADAGPGAEYFRKSPEHTRVFEASNWGIFRPNEPCGNRPDTVQMNIFDLRDETRHSLHMAFVGTPEAKTYEPTRFEPYRAGEKRNMGDLLLFFYEIPVINGGIRGGTQVEIPIDSATVEFVKATDVDGEAIAVKVHVTFTSGEVFSAEIGDIFTHDDNDMGCVDDLEE